MARVIANILDGTGVRLMRIAARLFTWAYWLNPELEMCYQAEDIVTPEQVEQEMALLAKLLVCQSTLPRMH